MTRSERIATLGWGSMVRNETINGQSGSSRETDPKRNYIDVNSRPFGAQARRLKSANARVRFKEPVLPDRPRVKNESNSKPPRLKQRCPITEHRSQDSSSSDEESSSESSSSGDE